MGFKDHIHKVDLCLDENRGLLLLGEGKGEPFQVLGCVRAHRNYLYTRTNSWRLATEWWKATTTLSVGISR